MRRHSAHNETRSLSQAPLGDAASYQIPSNLGHYVRDSTSAPPIPSSLPLSTVIDDVHIHQHPKGKYSKNNQRAPTPRATIYQRCLGHAVIVGDEPPALRGLVRGQSHDRDWKEGKNGGI